jgi:hypothetical protein
MYEMRQEVACQTYDYNQEGATYPKLSKGLRQLVAIICDLRISRIVECLFHRLYQARPSVERVADASQFPVTQV